MVVCASWSAIAFIIPLVAPNLRHNHTCCDNHHIYFTRLSVNLRVSVDYYTNNLTFTSIWWDIVLLLSLADCKSIHILTLSGTFNVTKMIKQM